MTATTQACPRCIQTDLVLATGGDGFFCGRCKLAFTRGPRIGQVDGEPVHAMIEAPQSSTHDAVPPDPSSGPPDPTVPIQPPRARRLRGPECPQCGGCWILYLKVKNQYRCRTCGCEFDKVEGAAK